MSKDQISLPKCKFQWMYINKLICCSNVWCTYFAYEINLACKICWPWITIMCFSTLYEWQNISVTRIIYGDVSVYRSLNCKSRTRTCLFFVRFVRNSFKAHQYFQFVMLLFVEWWLMIYFYFHNELQMLPIVLQRFL